VLDREELFRRKVRIERVLPFLLHDRDRQERLIAYLASINELLATGGRGYEGKESPDPERFRPGGRAPVDARGEAKPARTPAEWGREWDATPAEAGVDGRGTLKFEVQSPPGIGRLVRLPFYLSEVGTGTGASVVVSDGGINLPAVSGPTVIVELDWGGGDPLLLTTDHGGAQKRTGLVFQTRPMEWADVRIVSFVTAQRTRLPLLALVPAAPPPIPGRFGPEPALLVKNLSVGGAANLFLQSGYSDAAVYSASVPEFSGLRDTPILKSPNTASVAAAVSMVTYGSPVPPAPVGSPGLYALGLFFTRAAISFSLSAVCEILDDKDFGAHVPGPYARRDAIGRRPGVRGVGFVP
jgi:hypothetical protein